jgi:TPR repeat protein
MAMFVCGQDCSTDDALCGNGSDAFVDGRQYQSVKLPSSQPVNDPRLDINNPVCQFKMGLVFHLGLQGDGVNTPIRDTASLQDSPRAARWYKRAADKGYPKAQYNLGVMYSEGDGVAKDRCMTAKLYRAAAIQNLIEAQYDLACMLYYGDGVPKDQTQALHWWEIVAKQLPDGCSERELHLVSKAKNNVANLNRQQACPGQSTRMVQQAESMFNSVAREGSQESPEALYRLGMMHYQGETGRVDKAKGIELWSLAAHQGHQEAQNVLMALQKKSTASPTHPTGVGGRNWQYERF